MAAALAPCSWDPIPCGCELGADEDDRTPEQQYAVDTASYVIWALSGRQFGTCELSFRPCRRDCGELGLGDGPWGARLVDGAWVNLPCRSCRSACACRDVAEVRIPHAPVASVLSVVMDGEEVDEELWRLEDSEWLVLAPGAGAFPACQDMSLALGEAGTWGVRYKQGVEPPVAGRRAVGALACEIIKACKGGDCKLPQRTRSYTRQGVTVAVLDPMDFFDRGRTGIYEVDLFLNAANPASRPSGARVMSPDSEPRRRDAGPG